MSKQPRMIRFESGEFCLDDVHQMFRDVDDRVKVTWKDASVSWFEGLEATQIWVCTQEFWEPRAKK